MKRLGLAAALLMGAASLPGLAHAQAATTTPAAPSPAPAVPPAGPDDVVAQRGDVKLTAGQVRSLVEHADPNMRTQLASNPAALSAFVRDQLMRLVLLQEAKAKGFDQTPDMQRRIAEVRDAVIEQTYLAALSQPDSAYPSQAELEAAYEQNKARFTIPRQVHVLQIALLAPQGADAAADEALRKKLVDMRQQIIKTKGDFADFAKKNSQDRASAERGGDMGWLRDDQLLPEIRAALSPLVQDGISEPVRSGGSWHLLKLVGTKPPAQMTLLEVHDQLVAAMRQTRAQQLAKAYLDDMVQKQPIELNEIDLSKRLALPK